MSQEKERKKMMMDVIVFISFMAFVIRHCSLLFERENLHILYYIYYISSSSVGKKCVMNKHFELHQMANFFYRFQCVCVYRILTIPGGIPNVSINWNETKQEHWILLFRLKQSICSAFLHCAAQSSYNVYRIWQSWLIRKSLLTNVQHVLANMEITTEI